MIILSTTRLRTPAQVIGHSVLGRRPDAGEVQRLAAAHGLVCGVDLAARDSATIGGTVATNAGGIRVCQYGMTRDQVQVSKPSDGWHDRAAHERAGKQYGFRPRRAAHRQ